MRIHGLRHCGGLRARLLLFLVFFAATGQVQAGVEACWDLKNSFSPNDVNLAYQFVKDHGECVAHFEDPAFQAVAGSLTSMTLGGVLKPGQCSSILGNPNSQAAQQLLSVADAGVISSYLDCGCAVADSGIAKKIKDLVEDVVSCAKTFDPTGPISSGMEKAGDALGLSTLWGLESNEHNANAGVGNGGAPTEAYDVATCGVAGIPITSWSKAWNGSSLPPGQHVRSCNCPPPTRVYADGKFVADYATFHSPTFMCLVCPPGEAKDGSGNCNYCLNKSGPNGLELWGPNQDGSACVLNSVEPINPCKSGEPWNGLGGGAAVCCATWQTLGPDKQTCNNICPTGRTYNGSDCVACPPDTEQVGNSCQACPSGSHSNYADTCVADVCPPGQGVLPGGNECMVCPPDTQLKQGGFCVACTQGAHSKGGDDFCSISYFGGGVSCPAGTVHPPGDNNSCVCAPGTEEVDGLCKPVASGLQAIPSGVVRTLPPPAMVCPGATNVDGTCAKTCPGATVPNPQRPGTCVACPAGTVPNHDHTACGSPFQQSSGLKIRRAPIIKTGGGG